MSEFASKEETETKPVVATEDNDEDGPVVQEESTAVFTPVVHLEEVEVKTHEEDEDVVYVQRAKLFTFGETMLNKGTGTKSWNERGTGDVKFLKHKETNHIRVLMRQEKTMKILINHFLDPRIALTPNAGASDKSWVWVAFDFAEGELLETTFAIRFKTTEITGEFKVAFLAGQEEMTALLAGQDAPASSSSSDEVTDALSSLTVKSEEPKAEASEAEAPADAKKDDK